MTEYVPHQWIARDNDEQCMACGITVEEYDTTSVLAPSCDEMQDRDADACNHHLAPETIVTYRYEEALVCQHEDCGEQWVNGKYGRPVTTDNGPEDDEWISSAYKNQHPITEMA